MNTFYIAKRELKAYFTSPIAYVVGAAFLVLTGLLFYVILLLIRQASLSYLFSNIVVIGIFMTPAITMRLLSEEQKSGTIELLLTSPVRDWEVVLGKFLAALVFYIALLVPTLYYLFLLTRFGEPDIKTTFSGYLGLILFGGAALSIGMVTSALTSNQIVSYVLGLVMLLVLWFLNAVSNIVDAPLSDVLSYMSLPSHFYEFNRGIVDTKHVIYLVSVAVFGLFLASRIIEVRRWR